MRGARARTVVAMFGGLLWVAVPLVGLGWLSSQDRTATLADTRTVFVEVKANDTPTISDVDLALSWSAPAPVLAPNWAGVVQTVPVAVGEKVTSGSVVAVIDGVSRIAWSPPGAFYRGLGLSDRGPDVAWLKSLIGTFAGVKQTSGDTCNRVCVVGVQALAKKLGVQDASQVARFDPSWVVFLPGNGGVVATVEVTPGAPAPSAGTKILSFSTQLTAARFVARGALDAVAQSAGSGTKPDAAQVNAIVASALIRASKDQVLEYAGVGLSVDGSRDAVDAAGLAALGHGVAASTVKVAATLVRRPVGDEFVVPAAAIRAETSGVMCVAVGGSRVTVHVVSPGGGRTVVTGNLKSGDQVAVPVPSGSLCPSS